MEERRPAPAPCIINEGTLVNKRDMLRMLETLDGVEYRWAVEDQEISAGEALVTQVFAGRSTATLLANNCLFINVNSFDYLRFWRDGDKTRVELHQGSALLTLTPLLEELPDTQSPLTRQMLAEAGVDEETYVLLEDDSDDDV
jgi:hypothetical protein